MNKQESTHTLRCAQPDSQSFDEHVADPTRPLRRHIVEEREEIGNAHEIQSASEGVRSKGEAPQDSVSAVAGAHDGHLVPSCDALAHGPFHGVHQIVGHFSAEFSETRLHESAPESG